MRVPRVLPVVAVAAVVCLPLAACGDDKAPVSGSASGSGSGSGSSELATATAAPSESFSPQEAQAVSSYRTYVRGQVEDSIDKTKELVAAVKAGKIDEGQAALRPVPDRLGEHRAGRGGFGDLDPKVDLREADLEAGQTWTGWHVIEKALWETNTTTDMGPVADQLVTDLEGLARHDRRGRDHAHDRWPTAPRSCSTRSPPARSPARRRPSATPTSSTSRPTSTAPGRSSSCSSRWSRPRTRPWSAPSRPSSATSTARWTSTSPGTATSPTTRSPSRSARS